MSKRTYGPYAVLYIDPPWTFQAYSAKGNGRSAVRHYPVMTLERLKQVPVTDLAARDAELFLWVTRTHYPHALELLEAWGFRFCSRVFVWVKDIIGNGYSTRAQIEECWRARRGKGLRRIDKGISEVYHEPATEHSAKPKHFHTLIERLYGAEQAKVELFARNGWPGWSALGSDVDGLDIMESIPQHLAELREEAIVERH